MFNVQYLVLGVKQVITVISWASSSVSSFHTYHWVQDDLSNHITLIRLWISETVPTDQYDHDHIKLIRIRMRETFPKDLWRPALEATGHGSARASSSIIWWWWGERVGEMVMVMEVTTVMIMIIIVI